MVNLGSCARVCVCVAGLCEIIPGFGDLDTRDKATLMEAAYFDLWLVRLLSGCRWYMIAVSS